MFGLGWSELLIILIALGAVYALFFSAPARRRFSGGTAPDGQPREHLVLSEQPGAGAGGPQSAEEILAQRFARGELTDAEYAAKRDLIRQGKPE